MIEILIAIAVGVILIGVTIMIIAPVLQIDTETNEDKVGAALGRDLFERVRVYLGGDWHNFNASAATGSDAHYYLTTSTDPADPVSIVDGEESVLVSTTTYTRYFYIEDMCRAHAFSSSSQIIDIASATSGCSDGFSFEPSLRRVSIVYVWPESSSRTFSVIMSRFKNEILSQTDWSGGSGFSGPSADPTDNFSDSLRINFSSTTGSIKIDFE